MSTLYFFPIVLALLSGSLPAQQGSFSPEGTQAHLQLEERNCATTPALVQTMACHNGLRGQSAAKRCLVGVTYENGQELPNFEFTACALDCVNPQLKPDREIGCDAQGSNTCFSAFTNKAMWRSVGDLSAEEQTEHRTNFDKLIDLIQAAELTQGSKYKDLGGDAKRLSLKQQIVEFVFSRMTPYILTCAQAHGLAIPSSRFDYPNRYLGPTGGGMATGKNIDGPWMNIYESVFYDKDLGKDKDQRYIATPNVVAAAFIHEMVHWNQPALGSPEPRYTRYDAVYAPGDVEVDLNELMAYDRSGISTFYKVALTPKERNDWLVSSQRIYVERFRKDWAKLSSPEQQAVAKWAWAQPDGFMRRMMAVYPTENGGAWGKLCVANTGVGPCGMVGKE